MSTDTMFQVLAEWQARAEFRHFVLSSQDFFTIDLYDAGTRMSTKRWPKLSDALGEAQSIADGVA